MWDSSFRCCRIRSQAHTSLRSRSNCRRYVPSNFGGQLNDGDDTRSVLPRLDSNSTSREIKRPLNFQIPAQIKAIMSGYLAMQSTVVIPT